MKMVKSLLLGSAAGLVAVATGQAADLPVKAKPVEYVKVCSLYGAGFFYIPGTDKCIKIGGLLREQWDIHGAGDGQAYLAGVAGNTWTRGFTNDSSFRTRSVITVDVREQSSFGTIRAYTAFGAQQTTPNDPNSALYFTRSFVQFAGFTGGRAVSFFDFISYDPYGYSNVRPNLGNTGATGIDVFAYTAQLGNGVSATVSAEDSCASNTAAGGSPGARGCFVVNTSVAGSMAPGTITYAPMGYRQPDVVASLRADQAWGSAQLMGAYHPVQANYYGFTAAGTGAQGNGHPSDAAGFAAGGGFLLKNFLGMQGDQFGVQANWSRGAVAYLTNGTGQLAGWSGGANGLGNSIAFSSIVDGVYTSGAAGNFTTGSSIQLTTGWTVGGIYEHVWNPQWKSSLYGGYVRITYNDTAANFICNGSPVAGFVRGAPSGAGTPVATSVSSCDPNSSFWALGTRTQWNPNSNLDLGVDVMWNHLNSANAGVYSGGPFGGRPAGLYNINNNDVITAAIRAQYNFLP